MLRKSADVVERKEFHPLLFHTMRALTAYAGEYADGGISSTSSVAGAPPQPSAASSSAASSAAGQQQKLRRRDAPGSEQQQQQQAHKDRDPPGKKKSAFHDVPDNVLGSSSSSAGQGAGGHRAAAAAAPSSGAAAAAERVGAPGGQFSSAAAAASGNKQENNSQHNHQTHRLSQLGHKGVFSLKGIKKGIEKIGADVNKFVGDHDKSREDVPFDETAWCDEHFTRGCNCKSRKDAANDNSNEKRPSMTNSGSTESINRQPQQQQQQQASSATNNSASNNVVDDPDKPAKPCFQRPINPSSNLIANGWIDQQRRSKMRVVWKDVLASLVEGRRPGEETTLWIQRQVMNAQTGKVTGLEALHQIPMKWLEDVNYVDVYGDHRFTLKVYNIAEEFYFRTRDEQSAQSWVLTLRSARDASLEGNVHMAGAPASSGGSVVSEKKPSAKDMGLHDLDDWDSAKQQQGQEGTSAATVSPPLAQAIGDRGGDRRPSYSSVAAQPQQQQAQPASVRMPISELRAVAHGAGYDTRGMERQDLERIAAHVHSGSYNQNPTPAGAQAAGANNLKHGTQQEAAMREAEQRAAAEKREMEKQKAQDEVRRQKESDERGAVEKMRSEREEAEKRRVEEQMALAEQQRRHQEFEAQAAGIKRKQEEDRQRKMAELAAGERARQQQQQAAVAAAERKKREEEEQRRRQHQQQQQQNTQHQQQQARPGSIPSPPTSGGFPQGHQQQQARPGTIPSPPTSGGFPQGNFPQQQQWGQPQHQQQQHYQQWQQHQQQQAHFQQQQGFPGQHQQQPHQQHQPFVNQNMPPQGVPGGAYQQQQQQQQQRAHYQQQQQQQQQQKPQQPPPGPNAQGTPAVSSKYVKQMEEKTDEEDQSATCTLQIKRSILINWALQPPNLNVLRPIDQLISTIHTAMPPAFGVASHAYFSKFTPIAQTELIVSAHADETKLKKAVRKVRVFLHPDKLPRDLTSDQQFTARMLWDITSDSWEEFQKHKDELDWIRS